MRSRLNILVAVAAAILVVPQFATADSVEDQLQLMNERMGQLEDQLQATQDELGESTEKVARQGAVIEKAGLDREAQSGLSSFYNQVNISGWLAASWFYNLRSPSSAIVNEQSEFSTVNSGRDTLVAPFHPDHNSFSVDQLWFEIEKPVTEESRGGFRADLVYGKTAAILNGGAAGSDAATDFNMYQAYVQYLTPFGATLKAGKFGTLIGYEVAGSVYNFNITRGLVYNNLQPINHYGVLLEGQTDGGLVYGLGVVNSVAPLDSDDNNSKDILARIGWAGEDASLLLNLLWGNERPGGDDDPTLIVDVVGTFDPTESLSTWVNFTYQHTELGSDNPQGWGLGAAGRYAFTDRLGLALRLEYLGDDDGLMTPEACGAVLAGCDLEMFGITTTLDYALTDDLVVKAEFRWDDVLDHSRSDNQFLRSKATSADPVTSTDFTHSDVFLTGIELTYQF